MSNGAPFHASSLYHLLSVAGAAWWSKGLAVILGTFILEDATTMIAAMSVEDGRLSIPLALISLYIGVAVGDLGLYGLGAIGAKWPPARRWLTLPRHDKGRNWFHRNVVRTVVISRFIPGARLPLYTACGFFRAPFGSFAASAVVATLVWTSLLFSVSLHVGGWMSAHMASWRWFGIAGFILTILFVGRLIARFQTFSD
ncbi:VTT domain-containing protein [Asaia sp. VD9]|uniref:DedA family protein n=1 Tax=Asaia sp. VD9 TaxID=3081235 RepID=UPI0030187308